MVYHHHKVDVEKCVKGGEEAFDVVSHRQKKDPSIFLLSFLFFSDKVAPLFFALIHQKEIKKKRWTSTLMEDLNDNSLSTHLIHGLGYREWRARHDAEKSATGISSSQLQLFSATNSSMLTMSQRAAKKVGRGTVPQWMRVVRAAEGYEPLSGLQLLQDTYVETHCPENVKPPSPIKSPHSLTTTTVAPLPDAAYHLVKETCMPSSLDADEPNAERVEWDSCAEKCAAKRQSAEDEANWFPAINFMVSAAWRPCGDDTNHKRLSESMRNQAGEAVYDAYFQQEHARVLQSLFPCLAYLISTPFDQPHAARNRVATIADDLPSGPQPTVDLPKPSAPMSPEEEYAKRQEKKLVALRISRQREVLKKIRYGLQESTDRRSHRPRELKPITVKSKKARPKARESQEPDGSGMRTNDGSSEGLDNSFTEFKHSKQDVVVALNAAKQHFAHFPLRQYLHPPTASIGSASIASRDAANATAASHIFDASNMALRTTLLCRLAYSVSHSDWELDRMLRAINERSREQYEIRSWGLSDEWGALAHRGLNLLCAVSREGSGGPHRGLAAVAPAMQSLDIVRWCILSPKLHPQRLIVTFAGHPFPPLVLNDEGFTTIQPKPSNEDDISFFTAQVEHDRAMCEQCRKHGEALEAVLLEKKMLEEAGREELDRLHIWQCEALEYDQLIFGVCVPRAEASARNHVLRDCLQAFLEEATKQIIPRRLYHTYVSLALAEVSRQAHLSVAWHSWRRFYTRHAFRVADHAREQNDGRLARRVFSILLHNMHQKRIREVVNEAHVTEKDSMEFHVHEWVAGASKGVVEGVIYALRQLGASDHTVEFTGHSVGGAIACTVAMFINRQSELFGASNASRRLPFAVESVHMVATPRFFISDCEHPDNFFRALHLYVEQYAHRLDPALATPISCDAPLRGFFDVSAGGTPQCTLYRHAPLPPPFTTQLWYYHSIEFYLQGLLSAVESTTPKRSSVTLWSRLLAPTISDARCGMSRVEPSAELISFEYVAVALANPQAQLSSPTASPTCSVHSFSALFCRCLTSLFAGFAREKKISAEDLLAVCEAINPTVPLHAIAQRIACFVLTEEDLATHRPRARSNASVVSTLSDRTSRRLWLSFDGFVSWLWTEYLISSHFVKKFVEAAGWQLVSGTFKRTSIVVLPEPSREKSAWIASPSRLEKCVADGTTRFTPETLAALHHIFEHYSRVLPPSPFESLHGGALAVSSRDCLEQMVLHSGFPHALPPRIIVGSMMTAIERQHINKPQQRLMSYSGDCTEAGFVEFWTLIMQHFGAHTVWECLWNLGYNDTFQHSITRGTLTNVHALGSESCMCIKRDQERESHRRAEELEFRSWVEDFVEESQLISMQRVRAQSILRIQELHGSHRIHEAAGDPAIQNEVSLIVHSEIAARNSPSGSRKDMELIKLYREHPEPEARPPKMERKTETGPHLRLPPIRAPRLQLNSPDKIEGTYAGGVVATYNDTQRHILELARMRRGTKKKALPPS